MDKLELQTLRIKQHLRDRLNYTVSQNPVLLSSIRELRAGIEYCDFVLSEICIKKIQKIS